jgi:hypothetical protein
MRGSITNGRVTDRTDGTIVVFIIGIRINRFFPVGRWLRVARAMPRMLAELRAEPESGFLHAENAIVGLRTALIIQYWKSFEALEHYARDADQAHWPAWLEFNKRIGNDGSVGIFHETYVVQQEAREAIYVNMPPFGLGAIAGTVSASGTRSEARQRMMSK